MATSCSRMSFVVGHLGLVAVLGAVLSLCSPSVVAALNIELPAGFQYEVLFDNVPSIRSLTISSDSGIVYAGSFKMSGGASNVYALNVTSKEVFIVTSALVVPNGIAYYNKNLYIAQMDKVVVIKNIDAVYKTSPTPVPLIQLDDPTKIVPEPIWHQWRYLRFGQDGKLYVAIGSPGNTPSDPPNGTVSCELRFDDAACRASAACSNCLKGLAPGPMQHFGEMVRIDLRYPDPQKWDILAYGIRNSVGFDFSPVSGDLWFTDNGRDNWDPGHDNRPPDELNRIPKGSPLGKLHYGYPFCYGKDLVDYEFNSKGNCSDYVGAAVELGPHVAAIGMRFYTGDMFPPEYKNSIFIAEHGSWNRQPPSGYRVTNVMLDPTHQKALSYKRFMTGLGYTNSQGQFQVDGRPSDLLVLPDGSLLVSDDFGGRLLRITYSGA